MENVLDDAYEGFKKVAKERVTGPFFGSFIISWCVFHWEGIYATLFIDQDIVFQLSEEKLTKLDYINAIYDLGWVNEFLIHLVGPFLATIFIVFCLGEVDRRFYRKSRSIYYGKQKDDLAEKNKVLKEKLKEDEIKESLSDERKWEIEFLEASRSSEMSKALSSLRKTLYKADGKIRSEPFLHGIQFTLPSEHLALLDTNGLIEIEGGYVRATKKGKMFLKWENNKEEVNKLI